MLVLTRQVGEAILIGDSVRVMVTKIGTDRVKLGFTAPSDVQIEREEVAWSKQWDVVDITKSHVYLARGDERRTFASLAEAREFLDKQEHDNAR